MPSGTPRRWRIIGIVAGLPAGAALAVASTRLLGFNPIDALGVLPTVVAFIVVFLAANVAEVPLLWPRIFGAAEWHRLGRSGQAGLGLVGPISAGLFCTMVLAWAAMSG